MWPFVVAAVAVLAGVHAIDPSPIGVFYDDAHYVILGRALALGEGYRYINLPGSPVGTHFPPGYPALLALFWRVAPGFPENIALFKMSNAVLLGGVAAGTFWFARRRLGLSQILASIAALASTVTIPALVLSSAVMSEVLFLALLLPWLVFAEDSVDRTSLRRAVALGAGAGALCLIRSHGIVLLPALAVAFITRRAYREAAVATAAAVLVVSPWLWWVAHYDPMLPTVVRGQYGSYTGWLAEGVRANGVGILAHAARDNLVTMYAIIARSFSLSRNVILDALAVVAVLTLFVSGAIAVRRRAVVTVTFVLLYLASLLVWPFSPLRFMWGIWPLLVLIMVSGGVFLWRVAATLEGLVRPARIAVGCVAGIAVVGALFFNVLGYRNAWWATVARSFAPRIQAQLVWVSEKTGRDDIVVADDETPIYLYTGRRAVPASAFTVAQYFRPRPAEENARHMARVLETFAPSYVVAWSRPSLDAAAILAAASPALLAPTDTIPSGRVFRYLRR